MHRGGNDGLCSRRNWKEQLPGMDFEKGSRMSGYGVAVTALRGEQAAGQDTASGSRWAWRG